MVAIARRSPVVLFGAVLLAPFLHALPASSGEDSCVHLAGTAAPAQNTSATSTKRSRLSAGTGGGQGGTLAAGICAVDNARLNTAFPLKTNADFVPITGDDALGFYCVYGVKASSTGGVGGNVTITLFELTGGEVLVFGSGYGNIAGANLFDAAYDMERVDQVIRYCMGKDPATTPLRLLAPHGHGDHINPDCNRELERLGYRIVEIAFHPGDFAMINGMNWTAADRALFQILPQGTSCLQELKSYSSPLGKLWVFHRPGHTDGSIDLVIDTKGDVTNRFVVRGSQASSPCAPLAGQREIIDAHGNAELFSIKPFLSDVAPLGGSALGGTPIAVTGANFTAAGAGTPRVLVGGAPATEVLVTSDTSLTCKTPPGPPGELVEVAVVNNNGKALYSGTYFYNPLPTLTSLSPTSGDWRGGTVVQVRGSGYMLTAGVNEVFFGGVKATNVSVKSDSLLTCRAPAGTPGRTVSVLLRNPNGETKLDNAFLYSSNLVITSIEPLHASALGGTIVLLTGTAFTGNGATPTVTFGGVATGLVTLLSDTTVLAVVPPGPPGTTVDVVLTNSLGSAVFSGFRYHAFPRITSLAPISGRDQGGTQVTLNGSGFLVDDAGTNNVRFGGTPAQQVTVLSDGSLRCLTPPGARGTSVNVTISNQNGTAVLPLAFTYSGPLEVTAVQPGAGSSLGGTLVTLTGNGFVDGPAGTNTVRFGGALASQVVAVDDRTLTCRTPAGTPLAVVDVELTNNNGTLTLPGAFRYSARPTLATVAPNHGNASTSTPVAITGTGFLNDQAGVNVITVGGAVATGLQVLNDTSLVCNFPPGVVGATVNVVLANQNGSATLAGGFRYHSAPTLTALSPADGGASQQLRVTLTGTGFFNDSAGLPAITFGGLAASAVSVTNDTSLRCNAPVGPAGQTVDVVLTNARGSAALPRAYRFHARPILTSISPTAGSYQGGTTVTLTGTGFLVDGAGINVVNFGGSFASNVVVVNDTTLRCSSPPGVQDAVVDVVVSNTNGTAFLTGAFGYTISPPVVTAVSPASGPAQTPGSVQLTGSGFLASGAGTNTVRFGSLTSGIVGVIDNTRLSCQVPPGTPGTTVDVVVINANGAGQLARAFRYHALPVLTSLSQTTGGVAGGATVQLTGSGFQVDSPGTNTVAFGSAPAANVTVVNNTTLTCTVPAGTSGTTVGVRVSNANGQTAALSFTYHPRPTLLGLTPGSGPPTGGTRVTLRGTGFVNNAAGPNAVRIGPRAAANIAVVSDTELTCITPPGDAGSADVVVSNANGAATLAGGFFYGRLAPTILGLDPTSGPARGGNTVTLKGRGFTGSGTNSIEFGGVLATSVVTLDDATMQCTVPSGKFGAVVDVELANAAGTSVLASGYRYHVPPSLASISPTQGKALEETKVTLTGTGFVKDSAGETVVLFGGVRAREVVVLDDTRVTCKAMGGGPGAVVDVTLRNANGSDTLEDAFRVTGGPPVVESMTPIAGPFTGGTRVEFVGRGFAAGPVHVTFGDQAALSIVVSGDTLVSCVTPPGTIGEHVTVLLTTKNGSVAIVGGFAYEGIRPVLTGITPNHGPAAGGLRVTLTGSALKAAGAKTTRVTFGGAQATDVVVLGDTSVICTVPPGAEGTSCDVVLQNENGRATLVQGFRYHSAPTLSAITPRAGRPEGGTLVALTGTGFSVDGPGTSVVLFGTRQASSVSVVSNTVLACTTPPGTLGADVDVTVTNANGSAVLTAAFGYRIPLQITSVSPASGPTSGGTALTITGSGFQSGAGINRVTVKGATALDVVALSDTILTCRTAPVVTGSLADVVVTNDNGSFTAPGAFRYIGPPSLSALAPVDGPAAGGTLVTLTGSGFLDPGAGVNRVLFGGVDASAVTVVSDATITCTTPPGAIGARVDVRVQNGNGAATLAGAFRYHDSLALTQLTPDHGPRGGSTVTLTGRGFLLDGAGTNTVTFGGAAATQVVVLGDTSLSCRAPAGVAGATVDVSVTNANGSTTLGAAYRYHREPTLSAVAPVRGPASGGTSLTLTGTGFQVDSPGAIQVIVGSLAASGVVVLNDTTLTCTTPPGTAGQSANVTVANANGQATLVGGFLYNAAPTLTALLPASGSWLGGTRVTLTGSGFTLGSPGQTSVRFGGVLATNVTVQNDTTLACSTPPGTMGAFVDVSVSNLSGAATLVAGYRYTTAPTLASLAPDHGTALGGTVVTLTGTGFADAAAGVTQVSFGGIAATAVTVLDDQHVRCTAPAGAGGATANVVVSNQNGAANLPAGFRYHALPLVQAVLPTHGSSTASTSVALAGSGFLVDGAGPNTVRFGSAAALNVVVLDDATLTCDVGPQASGTVVDVRVGNLNGEALKTAAFVFDASAAPTIASITPASGPAAGGGTATLTGTGFLASGAGTNAITFAGVAATNVSVLDDTSLTCTVPAGTAGTLADVRLSNANGSALLAAAYRYRPLPTLTALSPGSGPAAGGGTVTLTGTGFLANGAGTSTITFAGVAATNVSVLGDTSVTCTVPAGTAGTLADVGLGNANGSALLAAGYRYYSLPTITSVSPVNGPSRGGTLVTIRGTGFLDDAAGTVVVKFADRLANSVGVFEDGRLTCRAPSGPAGTSITITLTTANGEVQLVNGYRYNDKPTLTSVSPADGPASGGTRVTLAGTGFLANGASQNAVSFGGFPATNVVVRTDKAIDCTVPAGANGASVSVSVTNVNGSASLPNGYRYYARPTLASLSPGIGPLAGGTTVTLAGTGFQVDSPGTNRVTFGGRPAASVVVQSDVQLTCVTPAGAASGAVDVLLHNDNGESTLLAAFAYDGVLIVAAAMPSKGTTEGSTSVTVLGSGFAPDSTVSFGSQAALNVVVVDPSTIECLTPPSAGSAWVDVKVSSSMGEASLPQGYQYVAPPTLADVEPDSGTPLGGTMVVLSGSGFLDDGAGENHVTFAGRPATDVSVLDDQHLTCEVPGGPALVDADVEVTNENGRVILPRAFRWKVLLATDLNSDGRGDLVLSSPGDDSAGTDAGAVRVFFGSSLPIGDRKSAGADVLVLPKRIATSFGMPVAAGDLDGDGDSELLIGAPLDDSVQPDAGAVYVFRGPHATSTALSVTDASTQRMGTFDGQRFGTALCLRDVDRNGVLDLMVGATGGTGAVHVYLGGAGGLAATPARVVPGGTAGDRFGYGVATGDLDGDGWVELLVGAPNSLGASTGPTARPGAVRVYRGGPTLYGSTPWLTFSGTQDGESFGSELVASDLTGDGREDLVVGSPWASRSGAQSGAAFVFPGGTALVSKDSSGALAILAGEGPGDLFGYALSTGDVNGDGLSDLLAGAPRQSTSGRAYLFLGSPGFDDRGAAEADVLLQAEAGTSGEFGRKVALLDVDGNGLADMVVTAPRLDSIGTDVGRVYVFRDSINPARQGENDDATVTGSKPGEELGRSTTGDH